MLKSTYLVSGIEASALTSFFIEVKLVQTCIRKKHLASSLEEKARCFYVDGLVLLASHPFCRLVSYRRLFCPHPSYPRPFYPSY